MVTNAEIKAMMEAKRKGTNIDKESIALKNKRINELMSKPIHKSVKGHLNSTLKSMARMGNSIAEIEQYYKETVAKTEFIESRRDEYAAEAKLADHVYKAYITDGVSRLEKINGRFLASLSIKTDILIEQNNRIISLLEKLVNNDNSSSGQFCPECGIQNIAEEEYCTNCGTKL